MEDKGLVAGFVEVFAYPIGFFADFLRDVLGLLNEIIQYPITVIQALFNTSTS